MAMFIINKTHFWTVLFGLLLILHGSCGTKNKTVAYPEDYKAEIDLVYIKVNNWEGRMDLYTNPEAASPTPVVLNIHGGGWNHGNKESQTGFGHFFQSGFAVANVEYRLEEEAGAPAAVQDVRCALIYLYKNAKALNIDTNKIVVMGTSAGAHLGLLAGLLGKDKKFDSNCEYDGKIEVAAIIDKYGPTDLVPGMENTTVKKWLKDKSNDKEFVTSVSPIYYVSQKSPPVIIIHGNKDPIVPYRHSVSLYDKLKSYHVKTELVTIEGGVHGKFSQKEKSMVNEKVLSFLKELELVIE